MRIDYNLANIIANDIRAQITEHSANSTQIHYYAMNSLAIESINESLWESTSERQLHSLLKELLSLDTNDRAMLDAGATASCYDRLSAETPGRHLLLVMLAVAAGSEHLHELVERIVTDPPPNWQHVAYALSALMRHRDWDVDIVFPRLLDGLAMPSVAAPCLDLANFTMRSGMLVEHPAQDRAMQLAGLLGAVVGQLDQLAANPQAFGDSVELVQNILSESISVSVSICDALGLIANPATIGKLNQALGIPHRRVQTEAAGALARMGDEAGRKHLLQLAAEPSARLRVLSYAEELGLVDQIPEEYQDADAQATAEMALWLSQPSQVGLPPTEIEVIDRRRLFWPSFTDPVDCSLVRYGYRIGDRSLNNIGIVGPVTHVFVADLVNMPVADIYAAFAGWHAEHDEIFEVPVEDWNPAQLAASRRLCGHLEREGFDDIKPAFLGVLLDEHALVAVGTRDGNPCVLATDGLEIVAYPTSSHPSSLQAGNIWSIFKGRRMLRSFNSNLADS